MISFSGSLKIFLLVDCCDMRKGFNGLYGLVSSSFGEDPRSGALYVFCNRRHTRLKVLYFDGTGLWILSKRLERGTFSWPKPGQLDSPKLKLTPELISSIVEMVPDAWLSGPSPFKSPQEWRAAYVRYLVRRLSEPHLFMEEAIRARSLLV